MSNIKQKMLRNKWHSLPRFYLYTNFYWNFKVLKASVLNAAIITGNIHLIGMGQHNSKRQ